MENHKNQYYTLQKVAHKKHNWRWLAKTKTDADRQQQEYKVRRERFVQIDDELYYKTINKTRLRELRKSCLEIAGNSYVLSLDLLESNKKNNTTLNLYKLILKKEKNQYQKSIEMFVRYERYIKNFGLACGVIVDEKIKWMPSNLLTGYKPNVLRKYWEKDKHLFCEVQNVLYYLQPKNTLIEELFFEAVAIAGGENELAVALGDGDRARISKHKRNFERFRFKKRVNFIAYSKLFAWYIEKNR